MKTLLHTLFYIVLILFLILMGFTFFAWERRADIFSNYMTANLGIDISADDLYFTPHSIVIDRFTIGNPTGYQNPYAFDARTITIKAPLKNYFQKNIAIEQVWIDRIGLDVAFTDDKRTQGNWSELMLKLDQDSAKSDSKPRSILIKHLLFTDTKVDLTLKGDRKPKQFDPIPRIDLYNINSEEGFPIEELTQIIVKKLMEQISLIQGIGNMILNVPVQAAKVVTLPFTGLFKKRSKPAPAQTPAPAPESAQAS